MENKELLEKIRADITKQLADNKKRLEDIEKTKQINEFLTHLENGEFKQELLSEFFSLLELKENIVFFKNTFESMQVLKGNLHFISQYEKAKAITLKLKELCKIHLNTLIKDMAKVTFVIRIYSEVLNMLNDTNHKFTNEDIDKLLDAVNLTEEEKCEFVLHLVKNNVENISLEINEVKNQRKKELAEKKKKHSKKENIENLAKKADEKKEEANKEIDKTDEIEEVYDIYIEAEFISKKNQDNKKYNTDFIITYMGILKENIPFEKRLEIYDSIKDYELKLILISRDLKENILPFIKQDNSIDLRSITEKYNQTEAEYLMQLEKAADEAYDVLMKEIGMEEEADVCKEIESFLDLLNKKLIKENYKETKIDAESYTDLFQIGLGSLKESFLNFIASVRNYFIYPEENNIDDLKQKYESLVKLYELALEKYEETQEIEEDFVDIEETKKYDSISLDDDFYGDDKSKVKNIIIVMKDSKDHKNVIESDFEYYDSLQNKDLPQIIRGIKHMISCDLDAGVARKNSGHRVKSKFYSEKFQKDNGMKSKPFGNFRLFYSKYNTTISHVFPKYSDKLNIVFVHSVGYGSVGGQDKEKINKRAIDRCNSYQEEMNRILALFQTDWSDPSLDSSLKADKMLEIEKIIQGSHDVLKELRDKSKGLK